MREYAAIRNPRLAALPERHQPILEKPGSRSLLQRVTAHHVVENGMPARRRRVNTGLSRAIRRSRGRPRRIARIRFDRARGGAARSGALDSGLVVRDGSGGLRSVLRGLERRLLDRLFGRLALADVERRVNADVCGVRPDARSLRRTSYVLVTGALIVCDR